MTIRNLDAMFKPASIALIGASRRPGSVGSVLARNLFAGGFEGPIMPVNPHERAIEGVLTYPDVQSLPVTPELAVVATPPETVPGLIAELGARGTRAAVVVTAGFAESTGARGRELQQAALDAARPHLLRIVGPNCLGIMVPGAGLNASFAQTRPQPGRIALVAQSGATLASVLGWADARGIGFSHMVSLGAMADVDFGDMLDYLANDRGTRAVLLYVEAITQARKFMSAARAAARMKPVIVVKAGRHAEGARAAASHTGALAGSDAVYEAAFRRAGMLRVTGLEELFEAVETLAMAGPPKGDRLAIVTNGGGVGVMATDALIDLGGRLAELDPATLAALDAAMPPTWSHGNPVDIIGDAPPARYRDALAAVLGDRGIDAVLVLNCPVAVASSIDAARAVIETAGKRPQAMLLTCWLGEGEAVAARRLFAAERIPSYDTPMAAVRAFMQVVTYRRNQDMLIETPPSVPEDFTPDAARAAEIVGRALAEGRAWLSEPEAKDVLAAYKIPVAPARAARTADEAAALAAAIDGAVVLKILSPALTHKSDVGGVALDLKGPEAVREAARTMAERVRAAAPEAKLEGFSVQPMVHRPGAVELIAGATVDATFGPTILFGHGGTAVEVIDDTALALPPLNMRLAREMMSRTRVSRQLAGYRGRGPVDRDAIALTLVKLAQLVVDHAAIAEVDVNPLLADESGVIALDARIRVGGARAVPVAIRPYPKELEQTIALADGRTLLLRPVVPEDEPALQASFAKLTPEEVRLRFFVPMKALSHVQAARFTQIDYDREMALVLTEPGRPGAAEIFGVVRITADPDNERAEYALIVRGDMTGMGLGILLMRRIVDYARGRGIGEVFGDVLRENATMLKLCDMLGFERAPVADEPDLVRVRLKL